MDNSFFAYLQLLEIMAFFSAYPLLYAVVQVSFGHKATANNFVARVGATVLPYSYALVATLFLGFQLKKICIAYTIQHGSIAIQQPWLMLWALLAVLFWVPRVAKKAWLSLLHSLVFLLYPIWQAYLVRNQPADFSNMLANDVHVYTSSVLLNFISFGVILLAAFFYLKMGKRQVID